MDHADHVRLLRDGVGAANPIPVWIELGAGGGAFTLALADLLPPGSVLHAVDKDQRALAENERAHARFARGQNTATLKTHLADFTKPLDLPAADGVLMANSLHFVRDKGPVLARVRAMLKPGAPLLLVEYDADAGNPWVPYPVSFETWKTLAVANGFSEPRLLASEPSRFLRGIYSAASSPVARG